MADIESPRLTTQSDEYYQRRATVAIAYLSDVEEVKGETKDAEGKPKNKSAFGKKTIGALSSIVLLFNNMTGPALANLSSTFQSGGFVIPILTLLLSCVFSSFSSTILCETMAMLPGNGRFQHRVEYSTLAKDILRKWEYYTVQIFLNISLLAFELASIVQTSQQMDFAIVAISGSAYALELYPNATAVAINCSLPASAISPSAPSSVTACDAFSTPFNVLNPNGFVFVISVGFLIVLALSIPLGLVNLEDNIFVQHISFWLAIVILLFWMALFIFVVPASARPGLENLRPFGTGASITQAIGTVLFNFSFVTTVPSWVNEKKENVSVNKSIWSSATLATSFYLLFGLLGPWAFCIRVQPPFSDTILESISSSTYGVHVLNMITVYVFPVVVNLTSIPIYGIVIKYNLIANNICGKKLASFLAIVLPWFIVLPLYAGSGFQNIVNYSAVIFQSAVNFIFPPLMYLRASRLRREGKLRIRLNPTVEEEMPEGVGEEKGDMSMVEAADGHMSNRSSMDGSSEGGNDWIQGSGKEHRLLTPSKKLKSEPTMKVGLSSDEMEEGSDGKGGGKSEGQVGEEVKGGDEEGEVEKEDEMTDTTPTIRPGRAVSRSITFGPRPIMSLNKSKKTVKATSSFLKKGRIAEDLAERLLDSDRNEEDDREFRRGLGIPVDDDMGGEEGSEGRRLTWQAGDFHRRRTLSFVYNPSFLAIPLHLQKYINVRAFVIVAVTVTTLLSVVGIVSTIGCGAGVLPNCDGSCCASCCKNDTQICVADNTTSSSLHMSDWTPLSSTYF